MEAKVAAIRNRGDNDLVWLLEHPPLYTAGTSANARDLVGSGLAVVRRLGEELWDAILGLVREQ